MLTALTIGESVVESAALNGTTFDLDHTPVAGSVVVTLDREVKCEPDPSTRLMTRMDNPVLVFGADVVLELKFTNRFPDWFKDLVRIFGLMQCGAAKYVDGVTRFGQDRINRAFVLTDPDRPFNELERGSDSRDPIGAIRKSRP